MAKLLTYYRLCPLIDYKSFLGVSEDKEKGVVIVTLGRNIAIKYRLSDQKQLTSWRTRDKFSSPVVYDKNKDNYLAVFNENFIRVWTEDEESLDKLKKYKFNYNIHTLIACKDKLYIVFKSGSIYVLDEILESRKSFEPEKIVEDNGISDVSHVVVNGLLYIGFLVKNNKFFWTNYNYSKNKFMQLDIEREDATLTGWSFHADKEAYLLTVWSDGRIYSKQLTEHMQSENGDLFTVVDVISSDKKVQIVSLDENYIAVYGADPDEEGSLLVIYNTQFKIIQSRQQHKLFTNDSKIWRIENNLFLTVGQYLFVVPFRLESEQLAALIGSHKSDNKIDAEICIVNECEIATWQGEQDKRIKLTERNLPKNLKKLISEYVKQGLPESLILEEIISEILENKDIELLTDCLRSFVDFPEKLFTHLLKFVLTCDKKLFNNQNEVVASSYPLELQPLDRRDLLDKVLLKSYSDVLLLPCLKAQLTVDELLLLLKYVLYILSEEGHNLPSLNAVETEKRIISWSCLLLDSSYQKLVLSKDDNVRNVLIQFQNLIVNELDIVAELQKISPILEQARSKTLGGIGADDNRYSVEQISLF